MCILKKTSKLVNFCVAFFFQHVMLYYFKKGKNTAETQRKICAVYGEGAVTDQMCQKWFAKFYDGDFSLEDAIRSGRQLKLIAIKWRH